MRGRISYQDGGEIEVDTERYKLDASYRKQIHEEMEIAEWEEDLHWDHICATEEELAARGEKPAFSTADYPTEEAAMEALDKFLDDALEEALREAAAEIYGVRESGALTLWCPLQTRDATVEESQVMQDG